jgi:hypothetical protein
MNQEPSSRQLREEFDKPPTPELKPEIRHRYDPEKRLLPGRPSFGGASVTPPTKDKAAAPRSVESARKDELKKQLSLEERKFKESQKQALSRKKEQLNEKQSPERFSIKNEKAEIGERMEKKSQSSTSNMLYRVSGQGAKDQDRLAALERREKALDQEFSQGLSEFEKSQENERHRFGEVIEFYRNEGEHWISEQSHERKSMNEHGHAQTMNRSEGRDGR